MEEGGAVEYIPWGQTGQMPWAPTGGGTSTWLQLLPQLVNNWSICTLSAAGWVKLPNLLRRAHLHSNCFLTGEAIGAHAPSQQPVGLNHLSCC